MKEKSSEDRLKNIESFAKEAFETHKYKKISDTQWRLQREDGGSCYWCDVVIIGGSHVVVTGDIDLVCFAYYCGKNGPEGALRWIAEGCKKGSWSYLREKASIGMSNTGVETFDDGVFEYDLKTYFKQSEKDRVEGCDEHCRNDEDFDESECKGCEYGNPSNEEKVLAEAIEMLKYSQREEIVGFLNEKFQDQDAWEWTYSLGKVIDSRVVYAAHAICKLVELLDVEEAEKKENEKS